jgi:small-conductance mechanosensitive channel
MAPFIEIPAVLTTGLGKVIYIITILFIAFLIERIIRKILQKSVERASKRIKVDHTQFAIFKHLISFTIYVIAIALAISVVPSLKTAAVSIFAGAGVLAIIIGFGAQKTFANIISGLIIAIFKPFRVGDLIKWGTNLGKVEDITLNHTVIRNFENKRIIVPNSKMTEETVENFNIGDDKICRYVEFGISYDSDVEKAMKIMREEAMKHPEFVDNRSEEDKKKKEPPVRVRVLGYGDSSVNIRAWVWAKDPGAAFRLGTDLNISIKKRFDKEGIEIPFPYRTIVFKDKKPKRR